jgi:hypothetical protein
MSKLVIELPESIRKHAEHLAASKGISLDQFLASATAEKISALEAGTYIAQRAAKADEAAFRKVLAKVPPGEPVEEWDKLPQGPKQP